ncbi:MAG: hypothetical protein J6V20_01595 [Bacteroidaceae bacterium]|nr:hypothetical protein [Bacteroidaceae bacterium]
MRQNTWIRGHFNPNKKVIGEFVCDAIFPMSVWYSNPNDRLSHREYPFTCLTDKEIMDYLGNGVEGYGWHISELKIYDNPKKLSEFFSVKEAGGYEEFKVINRPPQSWLYCEKIDAKPLVEGKTITIPKWEYKE